jgi:hypothetical protein
MQPMGPSLTDALHDFYADIQFGILAFLNYSAVKM